MNPNTGIVVCEGDEATGQFEALSEHVVLESSADELPEPVWCGVDLAVPPVADRLRLERLRLELNQTEFAAYGGVRKQAQILYEQGRRKPDTSYLLGIALAGADVTYILTGQRMPLPAALKGDSGVSTLLVTRDQRTFVAAAIMSYMDQLDDELGRDEQPADEERRDRAAKALEVLPGVLEQLFPNLNVRALLGTRQQ